MKRNLLVLSMFVSAFVLNVTEALKRIDEEKRLMVKEVTLDMSNSMRLIAQRCFPNAMRTIDRFHVQKLACDALQEMRVATDGMPSRKIRMPGKRPDARAKHTTL